MIRLVVFLAATLLFLVQPMVARQVLPALGGSAAVWTTCVAFFQLTLLAGYLYAHALTTGLPARAGALVHLVLVALAATTLPVGLARPEAAPLEGDPAPWLIGALAQGVGPCFLALAATTPLVQSWLARSTRPGARDPYYLFAASNLGSMAALVAYPLLLEPFLALPEQTQLWSRGYVALSAGLVAAAALTLRQLRDPAADPGGSAAREGEDSRPGRPPQASPESGEAGLRAPEGPTPRFRWLLLSFVPSSLMLGVTAHMANEVPALSLLWVTPLFLYLLTFALVFARRPPIPHSWVVAAHPPLLCLLAVVLYVPTRLSGFVIHLGAFFVSGLVLHGELARARPEPRRLTEYYLWISTGGALAGLFHALVAPHIFSTAAEYPLAILAAAALQPDDAEAAPPELSAEDEAARLLAFALEEGGEGGAPTPAAPARPEPSAPLAPREVLGPLALGLALVTLLQVIPWFSDFRDTFVRVGLLLVAGMAANYLRGRRVRFTLALAAVLAGGLTGIRLHGVVDTARSPHGVHRVTRDVRTGRTRLYHGSTVHGVETAAKLPSSYYHPETPIGGLLARARTRARRVGCIGLGAGSLAWYSVAGQRYTVYELDPVVARFAADPRYFHFLSESKGDVEVVLGDGRRRLAAAPDASFDFLLLDAFSSDAVPVHLLTREAVELYRQKLAPGGLLVLHASNRHLRLAGPAVAALDAVGMPARLRYPRKLTDSQRADGMAVATWVAGAHRPEDLDAWLAGDPNWVVPEVEGRLWTDDQASVLPLLGW